MMKRVSRIVASTALVGLMAAGTISDVSAATARHLYNKGHGYAYYGGHRHHRYYGNPAVGAAVAGTALGVIGLAAGAAAANRYDDGYGYGYYGPGPYYGGGYYPY